MSLENENIREVVIKTSHNSFSWGSRQLKGVATTKALISCLEQKARAIELDIWWHQPKKRYVVAHGLPATHPIS